MRRNAWVPIVLIAAVVGIIWWSRRPQVRAQKRQRLQTDKPLGQQIQSAKAQRQMQQAPQQTQQAPQQTQQMPQQTQQMPQQTQQVPQQMPQLTDEQLAAILEGGFPGTQGDLFNIPTQPGSVGGWWGNWYDDLGYSW